LVGEAVTRFDDMAGRLAGRAAGAVVPVGLCYEYAYKWQKTHGGVLVHGTVHDPWDGHAFVHAWVEKGGKAVDWQNMEVRGRGPRPLEEFYETWKPAKMVRFDEEEALLAYAHNRYFGPWDKESAASWVGKGRAAMDRKTLASELLKVAKDLVSVKFDTKKELEDYKREHGTRPGTKLELRDEREMQERRRNKKAMMLWEKVAMQFGEKLAARVHSEMLRQAAVYSDDGSLNPDNALWIPEFLPKIWEGFDQKMRIYTDIRRR
jgi:hypothetical protein